MLICLEQLRIAQDSGFCGFVLPQYTPVLNVSLFYYLCSSGEHRYPQRRVRIDIIRLWYFDVRKKWLVDVTDNYRFFRQARPFIHLRQWHFFPESIPHSIGSVIVVLVNLLGFERLVDDRICHSRKLMVFKPGIQVISYLLSFHKHRRRYLSLVVERTWEEIHRFHEIQLDCRWSSVFIYVRHERLYRNSPTFAVHLNKFVQVRKLVFQLFIDESSHRTASYLHAELR